MTQPERVFPPGIRHGKLHEDEDTIPEYVTKFGGIQDQLDRLNVPFNMDGCALEVISKHLCELGEETEEAFNEEPETLVLGDTVFDAQSSPVIIEGTISSLNLGTGWPETAYIEIGVRPEATKNERNAGIFLIVLVGGCGNIEFHLQDYSGGGRVGGVINIDPAGVSNYRYRITLTPSGTIGGTAKLEVWADDVSKGTATLPYGYASTWEENIPGDLDENFTQAYQFYSLIADRRGEAGKTYTATVGDATVNVIPKAISDYYAP